MYNNIKLMELHDFPLPLTGAPLPVLVSDEHTLFLCYYTDVIENSAHENSLREIDLNSLDETVSVVQFDSCFLHKFGAPNDEALSTHPLYGVGLQPYNIYTVIGSPWIEEYNSATSIRYGKVSDRLYNYHHYIFCFHDSTFECIASGARFYVRNQSIRSVVRDLTDSL